MAGASASLRASHGLSTVHATMPEPMRKPRPLRPPPADFVVVFVEQGRLDCEHWYRARRTTVTRWIHESGGRALIERRAAFVRHLREQGKAGKAAPAPERVKQGRDVAIGLVRAAAHFLRSVRNGGWAIVPLDNGEWIVGTHRRSPGELVDMAARRGFDEQAVNLQLACEEGVAVGR